MHAGYSISASIPVILIASLPWGQGAAEDLHRNGASLDSTYLIMPAHVMICIALEPEVRLCEVAGHFGITDRAVPPLVADLAERRCLASCKSACG